MKRIVVALAIVGLLASPALGAKKPKKPPPFKAQGSIAAPSVGLPITELEFLVASCPDMPSTQGLDGYVVEIPAELGTGAAMAEVEGTGVPDAGSFGFSFWSYACSDTLGVESGPATYVPQGTAYIIVFNESAARVDFEITVSIP